MATLLDGYTMIREAVYTLADYERKLSIIEKDLEKAIKKEETIRDKLFGFGSFGCILALICIISGFTVGSFIGAIAGFLLYWLVCTVIDSLMFAKRRTIKADKIHTSQVLPLEEKKKSVESKIERLYNTKAIQFYLNRIPPECQSLDAMDFFVEALTYKKAETEKELFLQWENESYRRQMLQMQSEQIQQIKQVANNQKEHTEALANQTQMLKKQLAQQKKLSKQVRYGNVVSTLDFLSKD